MEYIYELTIPSFLCGPDDTVGLDGLAGIFQEAAWQHARSYGVDFTSEESAVFWALHRLGVRAIRFPRWDETVRVTTWPSRIEKLYAMREYQVHVGAELVAEASSAWLILSAGAGGATSRPVPPQRYLSQEWTSPGVPLEMPLGRLPALPDKTVSAALGDPQRRWNLVRPSDTDRNEHVNNTRYAQWLRDAAPHLTAAGGRTLVLTFTAETRAGEQYTVVVGEADAEAQQAEVYVDPESPRCACRFTVL